MNQLVSAVKSTARTYIRIGSKVVLVCAVFLFVIGIFIRLMMPERTFGSMDSVNKQKEIFKREYSVRKSLSPEAQTSLEIEKLGYCKLLGEFCHDDLSIITPHDISTSASSRVADVFLYPFMNMPASGTHIVAETIAQAGLVPQAYAIGIGSGGLAGYSEIWKHMRNISYLVLILLILASGFMVMFKTKLDGSTAVTIENLLPKLVVTMILIQFSLTIVGFLIDAMYLMCAVVISLLGPLVAPDTANIDLINKYVYSQPLQILSAMAGPGGFWGNLWRLFYTIPDTLMNILGSNVRLIIRVIFIVIGIKAISNSDDITRNPKAVTSVLKSLLSVIFKTGSAAAKIGSGIGAIYLILQLLPFILFFFFPQIIIGFILVSSILVSTFKIFKQILISYIYIILLTIFAPVILLQDLLPSKAGFKPWIKAVMRELAMFPILIGLILISYLILSVQYSETSLILPFMFEVDPQALVYVIGILLLAMAPNLIEKAKTAAFGPAYSILDNPIGALLQGMPLLAAQFKYNIPGIGSVPGSKGTIGLPGGATLSKYLGKAKPAASDAQRLEDIRRALGL